MHQRRRSDTVAAGNWFDPAGLTFVQRATASATAEAAAAASPAVSSGLAHRPRPNSKFFAIRLVSRGTTSDPVPVAKLATVSLRS